MQSLYHISVFLHILSAIIWIGGMLFMAMIVVPVTRKPDFQALAGRLFTEMGTKFRNVGWACLILIFITGFLNLTGRFGSMGIMSDPAFWTGPFGGALASKISIFILIVLMSIVHDFFIGPKAAKLLAQNPDDPKAIKLRNAASWFGRINLFLGLLVVYLAIGMIRGL